MNAKDMGPDDVGLVRNEHGEMELKLGKPGRRMGVLFTQAMWHGEVM